MTDYHKFTALAPDKLAIVRALRKAAQNVSKDVTEGVKWNALCFFKGDRAFVGIMPYQNYVSIIFDRGSDMTDELGVLEVSGKQMRHIKIRTMEEIAKKNVADYIRNSYFVSERRHRR
jgi:hypothetical protein